MHISGKIKLTIEQVKRISGHQMSTSSSSLAGTPIDALHQCLLVQHDIPFGAKHLTDILKK
jgi:hypothetical protein